MDASGRRGRALRCAVTELTSIRTIARVFSCVSKIGEDVSLAATARDLVFRSLNASRSVSAEIAFRAPFFGEYEYTAPEGTDKPLDVVVASRHLVPVLRNPGFIRQLSISFKSGEDRIKLGIVLRNEVRKTFQVPFEDGEVLRAVYSRDRCTCNASVRPRFLSEIVSNFHGKLEELTLACSSSQFRVMSFIEDAEESTINSMLRTEMAVDSKEFEEYLVPREGEVELTFSFRAFRAILELAEGFEVPLRLFFDRPGLPILFTVSSPGSLSANFEAQFILATRQVLAPSTTDGSRTDLHSTGSAVGARSSAQKSTGRAGSETRRDRTNTSIASFLTRGDRDAEVNNLPTEAGADEHSAEEDDFVEGTPPPDQSLN